MSKTNFKRLIITHVINPVDIGEQSDLYLAQPVTFKSIHNAIKSAQDSGLNIDIDVRACGFEEDKTFASKYFSNFFTLEKSAKDLNQNLRLKKLPLISEILSFLVTNGFSCGTEECQHICIYTNVDIAVQKDFYIKVASLFRQGYDCFTINRRTISKNYTSPEQLDKMYSEKGDSHPGHDCFVFKEEYLKKFVLGDTVIGANWVGRVLLSNLYAFANNFKTFEDLHLTFHLGDDHSWRGVNPSFLDIHNEKELCLSLNALLLIEGHNNNQLLSRFFDTHTRRVSKIIKDEAHYVSSKDHENLFKVIENDVSILAKLKSPIFLTGFPRSGTTYLQALIGSNQDLFLVIPETHFFTNIKPRILKLTEIDNFYDEVAKIIREFIPCSDQFITFLATHFVIPTAIDWKVFFIALMCDLATTCGYTHKDILNKTFIEKTPDHGIKWGEISLMFPNSKQIIIVRNPIMAISSRKKAFTWEEFSITKYCELWNRAAKNGNDYALSPNNKTLVIRYEDLLDEADSTIIQIYQFICHKRPESLNDKSIEIVSKKVSLPWEIWKMKNQDITLRKPSYNLSLNDIASIINECKESMLQFNYLQIATSNNQLQKFHSSSCPISKERLLYVGHSYHKKTLSSQGILNILKENFEIDFIWVDPRIKLVDQEIDPKIFFETYHTVFHWQISPFTSNVHLYLSAIRRQQTVFAPMIDNEGLYVDGKLNCSRWKWSQQKIKYISFSRLLSKQLSEEGANFLSLKYGVHALQEIAKRNKNSFELPSCLFVYRKKEVSWNIVKKLISPSSISKIHIHSIPDPGQPEINVNDQDLKDYNITISSWLPSKQDFEDFIDRANIIILPRLYEGIGMLLLESMSKSKCVIAPNTPTANEYIKQNITGILFDPKNPQSLDLSNYHRIGLAAGEAMSNIYKDYSKVSKFIAPFVKKSFPFNVSEKRLLLIFPHNLFSELNGVKARFLEIIKILKKSNHAIHWVVFDNFCDKNISDACLEQAKSYFENVIVLNFNEYCRSQHKPNLRSKLPDFSSEKLGRKLRILNKIYKYETLWMSYVHWTLVAEELNIPNKVIFVEDLISLNISQRQKLNQSETKLAFHDECKRLSIFSKIVFISKTEQKMLAPFISNSAKHYHLTHISESIISPKSFPNKKILNISFLGSDNPFNSEGIIWFASQVLPKINCELQFNIAGSVCNIVKDNSFFKNSKINLQGYINCLDSFYKNTDLIISPMLNGTGLKIKVVEAIKYGLPVVGTKIGLCGLDGLLSDCCLSAEDATSMARQINNYASSSEIRKKLMNAILAYQDNYATIKKDHIKVIQGIFKNE